MKNQNKVEETHFNAGQDWYADRIESVQIQANRWFIGFVVSAIACILLASAIISILPLKTLVPMVVHQNTITGEVWIDRPQTEYVPANDSEVQSDIVRYITSRESYTSADINQRFQLVMLLSNSTISKQYSSEQSNDNKSAPVNILRTEGTRTVRIEDIIFIDNASVRELRHFRQPSHALAKVDFTTTTTDHLGNKKLENWVATIGWEYKALAKTQQEAWDNWNGFKVSTYRIDPKNINKSAVN